MERIIFDTAKLLPKLVGDRRVVALCDRRVAELHELPFDKILIDAGEENKTFDTVECVARLMIEMGAGRDTFLLGVGGGVVCDIAGFVAAVYMRGIGYGLVPTTLLAQADAAVGGKNGVDIGGYKNIIGTFGEPEFVLCDADLLQTLPGRELRSGLAEVAKAAIIGDPELFAMLESGDFPLEEAVRRAVAVKVAIVARDRHENNERRLLNLGHTIGHALEKISKKYNHGEAVAVGIVAAAGVAVRLRALSLEDERRITNLLMSLGLPVAADVEPTALREAMRADKKNYAGRLLFVLPTGIGSCTVRKMAVEDII